MLIKQQIMRVPYNLEEIVGCFYFGAMYVSMLVGL